MRQKEQEIENMRERESERGEKCLIPLVTNALIGCSRTDESQNKSERCK